MLNNTLLSVLFTAMFQDTSWSYIKNCRGLRFDSLALCPALNQKLDSHQTEKAACERSSLSDRFSMHYYCGLTQQLATKHQTAARSPLPFLHSGMGRRNGQQLELMG